MLGNPVEMKNHLFLHHANRVGEIIDLLHLDSIAPREIFCTRKPMPSSADRRKFVILRIPEGKNSSIAGARRQSNISPNIPPIDDQLPIVVIFARIDRHLVGKIFKDVKKDIRRILQIELRRIRFCMPTFQQMLVEKDDRLLRRIEKRAVGLLRRKRKREKRKKRQRNEFEIHWEKIAAIVRSLRLNRGPSTRVIRRFDPPDARRPCRILAERSRRHRCIKMSFLQLERSQYLPSHPDWRD